MDRTEAIEVIRKNWPDSRYTSLREALETLIPELAESKDEKARKWLTNLVENLGNAADEDAEKELEVMRPLALAYLEKQKETIPCNVDEFTLTLRNCLFADSELTEEQADIFATTYGEELLNVAIGKIKSGITKEDIADFKVEKQKDHFRIVTKMVEQKPAWSEDDEKMLDRIIDILNRTFSVYSALGTSSTRPSCPTYKDEIDWLKSLRPQGSKDSLQTHWKPSEEQIYSLGTVVKGAGENSVGSVAYNLKELYEELKKL